MDGDMNFTVGLSADFSKTVTEYDIYGFAGITGDFNPLHVNGEKAKDSKVGAMVLLMREHTPNTPPRMAPAPGPKIMAPRITGMWTVVALIIRSWIIPMGVLAKRMTTAAISATLVR